MSIFDQSSGHAPRAAQHVHRKGRRGLAAYLALWRQRRTLADLSPHQLRDIGLSQQAADREAARPIWDTPAHWRR